MRTHMKSRVPGLAAAALLLATASAPAQDFSKVEIKTVPVAGNISMLIGGGGNIGVSVGEDGVLLVDDEFAELIDKIKAAVAALNPGPIRFVLNTNWHWDHANGNELLAKAGAVVIAHENSRKHMQSEQTYPELRSALKLAPYPKEALPIIAVGDALTLYFNGDQIRMIHLPNAHTDGDLVFHFVKANVIHAGDTFFTNGFPFINISFGGTIDGMIKAADVILGMCDERTKVIPGHGQLSDRNGVRAFKDLLVAARARVADLIKAGKGEEEVVAAKPAEGLYKGGESELPADMFVRVLYEDLTGKYRKR